MDRGRNGDQHCDYSQCSQYLVSIHVDDGIPVDEQL